MKLSKLAKLGLLDAATIEEAQSVLELARQDAREEAKEAGAHAYQLETENTALKARLDRALGAEKPKGMDPDDLSVTHQMVWDVIKTWSAEGRKFMTHDLSAYFTISSDRANSLLGQTKNAHPFWVLYRKEGDKRHSIYVPVGYKPQVRERVVAMGTPSGVAVKLKGGD